MVVIDNLVDDSGILLTDTAIKSGITKSALYSFIETHHYEKVAHGVYISPDAWPDEAYILSLRYPGAVFSHDEALYYHGLTDREPMQLTITVYSGYGTARLIADGIKVYTIKQDLLDIGKIEITNSFGHKIPMYDLERTLCDLVRSRSSFEFQDFQTALKTYVSRKDKNLNRLMEYAKLFRVDRKVRELMEVLL